jgi:hypothetical protein
VFSKLGVILDGVNDSELLRGIGILPMFCLVHRRAADATVRQRFDRRLGVSRSLGPRSVFPERAGRAARLQLDQSALSEIADVAAR